MDTDLRDAENDDGDESNLDETLANEDVGSWRKWLLYEIDLTNFLFTAQDVDQILNKLPQQSLKIFKVFCDR